MPIFFGCPKCGRKVYLPDDKAGHVGRCKCGYEFVVPTGRKAASPAWRVAVYVVFVVLVAVTLFGLSYWLMH